MASVADRGPRSREQRLKGFLSIDHVPEERETVTEAIIAAIAELKEQDKIRHKAREQRQTQTREQTQEQRSIEQGFMLGDSIGAGAFGKVYKCHRYTNSFEKPCAVKVVKIEPHYAQTRTEVDVLKNEISILSKLNHERIVTYYGSEEKDDHLYLFMELMDGGSLSDYIKKKKFLSECESRNITRQILEGVSFLHSKDVIHRDIKGSNVLIDRLGDNLVDVKLADFGLSKFIQKVGSKTDLCSYCGSPYWMAPEIMWGEGYGRKVDIWSVGCTVVEMLTGSPPLGHLEPPAAMFSIGSRPTVPKLPEIVSDVGRYFIKTALTWDPKNRPWADELLRDWFVKAPWYPEKRRVAEW